MFKMKITIDYLVTDQASHKCYACWGYFQSMENNSLYA